MVSRLSLSSDISFLLLVNATDVAIMEFRKLRRVMELIMMKIPQSDTHENGRWGIA
jgi:hypothetical protein